MSEKDDEIIEVEAEDNSPDKVDEETNGESPPEEPARRPQQASGGGSARGALMLALLALLAAGAALFLQFQQPPTTSTDMFGIDELQDRTTALQQRLEEIGEGRRSVTGRLDELQQAQQQLQEETQQLSRRLSEAARSPDGSGQRLAQLQREVQQLGNRLERVQQSSDLAPLRDRLGELQQAQQRLGDRLADLASQQEQLDSGMRELLREDSSDNIDRALAEIEHLVTLGMHSLQLQDNPDAALEALQSADARMRDLDAPGLLEVRRQLTADINALQSVEDVDISGLSLYLADLAGRVADLPLSESVLVPAMTEPAGEDVSGEETGSAWGRLMSGIWQELRGLVVISRSDDTGEALLMPDERYFLYQNLRLQLETARTAVFRRDTANLQASLELILDWLQQYFDTDSNAVNNVLQSLREMARLELRPETPDISSSLESLRAYIRERAAMPSPATGSEGDAAS